MPESATVFNIPYMIAHLYSDYFWKLQFVTTIIELDHGFVNLTISDMLYSGTRDRGKKVLHFFSDIVSHESMFAPIFKGGKRGNSIGRQMKRRWFFLLGAKFADGSSCGLERSSPTTPLRIEV
ncbi:hypothetical protein K435DRAFT_879771 [Dendrothele bispora CBS 962.96]|uniref:Uncharacterized protein n=1 Tax=Dendrothele bispora (strain CBS 962.96) TaxID=1314807 RepID=A0A4S8KKP2_DENBC|nr:hypothetical protein K435DRAFT_879771 [Dendrothele bispora CBS 962.96]